MLGRLDDEKTQRAVSSGKTWATFSIFGDLLGGTGQAEAAIQRICCQESAPSEWGSGESNLQDLWILTTNVQLWRISKHFLIAFP